MAFIDLPDRGTASGPADELFRSEQDRLGLDYVPNYVRLFADRPAVYAAWRRLLGAITENMDPRRYELATLAAARALKASYCTLAHGTVLAERYFEPAVVQDLVNDRRDALDDVEIAVMDLAKKVADEATAVIPADIERLRELGLSDEEILDVVLAAAARCFWSKTLDALCVEPDAAYSALEPGLRDALTVGRPIASS